MPTMISKISKKYLAGLVLAALTLCSAQRVLAQETPPGPGQPQVTKVNLKRYAGRWYQIAHLPNDYESDCVRTTARYVALSPTQLQIKNVCYLADGSHRNLVGLGTVTHPEEPGKLEVMLPFEIRVDYWIDALDPAYRWSVVGSRDLRSLTILSRTPHLSARVLRRLLVNLDGQGYDVSQLVYDRY